MKTKRIVVICQVFHPDETSTSQLLSMLMGQLSIRGWRVRVLCGFPVLTTAEKISRNQKWRGISIRRCGLNIPLKRNLWFRGLAYFSFLSEVFFQLLFTNSSIKILGVTNPPFTLWILALISMFKRRSFSFLLHDIYPDALTSLGAISGEKLYLKAWRNINTRGYKRAEKLGVIGRDMRDLLNENYNVPIKRIHYMPNHSVVNIRRPQSFDDSIFREKWNLEKQFVVQYSGNMGTWHDIDTFIWAAKELEQESRFLFLFIGDGVRCRQAKELSKSIGLSNIKWIDFVPLELLSSSLAACHASLISLREGMSGVAVPCKLYGILAAGRPVIAQVPLDSEIAMTVLENKCGVVVKPGDVDSLVRELKNLLSSPKSLDTMGTNARVAYEKYYTLSKAVKSFELFLT